MRESLWLGDIVVHAFYSKPPRGDPQAGIESPRVTHLGYVIEMEGLKLYFTGDAINDLAEQDGLTTPLTTVGLPSRLAEGR